MTHFLTLMGDWSIPLIATAMIATAPQIMALFDFDFENHNNPFLDGLWVTVAVWLAGTTMGGLPVKGIPVILFFCGLTSFLLNRCGGWWSRVGLAALLALWVIEATTPQSISRVGGHSFGVAMAGGWVVLVAHRVIKRGVLVWLAWRRGRPGSDFLQKILLIATLRWTDDFGSKVSRLSAWRRTTVRDGVLSVDGGVSLRGLGLQTLPIRIGAVTGTLDVSHNRLITLDGVIGPVCDLDANGNLLETVDAGVAILRMSVRDCPSLIRVDNDNPGVVCVDRDKMRIRAVDQERRTLRGAVNDERHAPPARRRL